MKLVSGPLTVKASSKTMAAEPPAKQIRLSGEESEQETQQEEEKKAVLSEQAKTISKTRNLPLDMSKYGPNIQKMNDEELVQIFDIGVVVKESFTVKVAENSSFVKKELDKQMEPIRKEMAQLPLTFEAKLLKIVKDTNETLLENSKEMSEKAIKLTTDIAEKASEMSNKVLPVNNMENNILTKIDECKNEVSKLTQESQKPAKKGASGEKKVMSILEASNLPKSYTFRDVSKQKGKCDIRVQTPGDHIVLIEAKKWQRNVPKKEIDKFKRDVMSSDDVKVGIMISLDTGFDRKSKQGDFEVNHDEGKYLIYIPNALKQQEVIVWSVSLANELAGLEAELDENQAKKLQKLCEHFQEKVKSVKKCRDEIKSLQNAVQALNKSLEPIFQIFESANKELKEILNDPTSSKRPKPTRKINSDISPFLVPAPAGSVYSVESEREADEN